MKSSVAALTLACLLVLYGAQDKSLILYFPLDEGTGEVVKDQSGNGNNGVFKGKLKWVEGKYGKALEFPGNGPHVEIPDSKNLTPQKEGFTVVAWVNPDDLTPFARVVVSHWYGGVGAATRPNLAWVLETHNDTGTTHGVINWGDRGHSNTKWKKGEWQHVGYTWDGSTITFYYNGKPDGTVAYKDALDDSSEPVRIGRTDRDDFTWSGVIDEVKVWYRALTAIEIQKSTEPAAIKPLGKLATVWGKLKIL